jgi:arylamine N-acetyltransferase
MDLQRYFGRIGFWGHPSSDFATLSALQQAHVCSVPFENLDVQLGRPTSTDVESAFEKIVSNNRGGWCYEQNGLFGWVLSQIGFNVTRLAGNVMRADRGDASASNHLSLLVAIPDDPDRRYLVDVGFGGSLIEPIELTVGEHSQSPFRLGLRQLADGYWQFWENAGSGEFSFDFLARTADENALARKCRDLQTDPESGFVLNFVAQLRRPDQHLSLRGRVLKTVSAIGSSERLLQSADDFAETLRDRFGLTDPEVRDLWPAIIARHEQLQA